MVTIIKTKSFVPMGIYKETSVDKQKANAEFRLMQVSPNIIKWKSGKVEKVHGATLKKLQRKHTWATDF